MNYLWWWHWIIIGFVLMAAQFIIPSFTIVWFGLGALFTGFIKGMLPSFPFIPQLFAWVVSSLSFDAMWFKYIKRKSDSIKAGSAGNLPYGNVGLIIKGAAPHENAVVKFEFPFGGSDEWPCMANVPLTFGDWVKVIDFSDKIIKVAKINIAA